MGERRRRETADGQGQGLSDDSNIAELPSPVSRLPSGTVTFLFTDIEGSTRLWEAHPHAMGAALAQHDALLREAIESHEGAVFKSVGDQLCAAFATASAALAARRSSRICPRSRK